MRRDFIGALLFAVMFMQDRPSAAQELDSRAAAPQLAQLVPADCDKYAALPGEGQGREYNLFANLAGARSGCGPSVTYQKSDDHPAPSQIGHPAPSQQQNGRSAPSQQEELDRAACKSEGERAANAARGLQPGEYDLIKNMMGARSEDAQKIEQSCMTQRGYKSVVN